MTDTFNAAGRPDDVLQPALSPSTKGATSELLACAHLMRQGWHVFRCESPAAPFDLVAYRDGHIVRVEVKSIRWPAPGEAGVGPAITWPINDEWDLLVAVDWGNGDCLEIDTHDATAGRNQVRVAYGFPAVSLRMPRPALVRATLADRKDLNSAAVTLPAVSVTISPLARCVLDILRRDLAATWTSRHLRQELVADGWPARSLRNEPTLVRDAIVTLKKSGLVAVGSKKATYRAVAFAVAEDVQAEENE